MTTAESPGAFAIASAEESLQRASAARVRVQADGVASTGSGESVLRLPAAFFETFAATLCDELGDEPAREALYEAGTEWGERAFDAFADTAEESARASLAELPGEVVLERWWWSFQAAGFGTWTRDFSAAAEGVVILECEGSPLALGGCDARGAAPCEALAGLFAATFSRLAGRELAALELACGERCRFAVTVPERAVRAREARARGDDADTVLALCKRGG